MKRLTLSDFEPIYADWKNSGQSAIDYCASIGIKHKRFYMWKNRYELAHPQGPSEQKAPFIPVRLSGGAQAQVCRGAISEAPAPREGEGKGIEIAYPNGTVLRIRENMTVETLRSLITMLG